MSDNDGKEETRREEQHELERQQHDLFDELSREQTEAEQALEADGERSTKAEPHDKSDD